MKDADRPLVSTRPISLILVGYDGSPHADRALEAAGEIAARLDAALHLIAVIPNERPRAEMEELARAEHMADQARYLQLRADWERLFKDHEVALRSNGVRELRSTLLQGNPSVQIVAYARRASADLIVLGKRGLSPMRRMLLGSVSAKVTSLAPCAVLTV